MTASWFRHAALALTCAGSAALLAACGSGSVVSDLKPERFITVGDGFADVGQNGYRFTINHDNADGSDSFNWVQQFAAYYGQTVTPAATGGWGYAQGYARVASPDTTSGTNAPSVTAQIDKLLARPDFAFDPKGDVMVVNGGIADIVDAVNACSDSAAQTISAACLSSDAVQSAKAAGTALGQQVQRLVNAGATHVVVTGVYSMGNTPWANENGLNQTDAINKLTTEFNSAVKIALADSKWANNVLFIDTDFFYRMVYNSTSSSSSTRYPVDDTHDAICTTLDSTTCTPSTLQQVNGVAADPTRWLFADKLYITPFWQQAFVSESYTGNLLYTFKLRW